MGSRSAAERLLNLIIALSHARVRMTRDQIRATVDGYEPPSPGDSAAEAKKKTQAFERMFERDKDDLRRLGIPLRTITDPVHGDDIGYAIDAAEAALQPVDMTPLERAVVAAAADYWRGAEWAQEAHSAAAKIASVAERGAVPTGTVGVRAAQFAAAAPALGRAISARQAVRFTYTSASSGRAERTVEPWRLVVRGSAIYLVGLDRDRQDPRTYRLNRIEADGDKPLVRPVGPEGAFEAPASVPGVQLTERVPELTATVGLRAEAGHSLRRRGAYAGQDGDWDLYDIPYTDTEALRDEVLALAGSARVVAPDALRDSVLAHARAALEVARG